MQSAKLIVKNFGPLKDINIEVKDFLCLIGKQATGKSTIAKLIAIFEDEQFNEDFFIESLMKYGLYQFLKKDSYISFKVDSDNVNSIFYFDFEYSSGKAKVKKFRNTFSHLFNQKKITNVEEIELKTKHFMEMTALVIKQVLPNDKKSAKTFLNIIKKYSKDFENLQKKLHSEKEYIEKYRNEIEAKIKVNKLTDEHAKFLEKIYFEVVDFIKLDSLYIPSERSFLHIIADNTMGLINNKIQIPPHLLEIGQEYEKALNNIKELPLTLISKEYRYSREGKSSYIHHNNSEKIDLLNAASGMQSIIPIILLIEYTKTLKENYNFSYIIEEPELNIYPHTQHQLLKYLSKNIFDFDTVKYQRKKMVITTHSPYILASINNLLLAYQKGISKPKETQRIIPKQSWINPDYFTCYELRNGKAYKIMNTEIGQIKSNMIDKVSDEFSDEFDRLLAI